MSYQRPEITTERINEINRAIHEHPDWNRTRLSKELCEMWDWKGENGQYKDISCRDMLRALDTKGRITLPPSQSLSHWKGNGDYIIKLEHDTAPVEKPLSALMPLRFEIVTAKNELIAFKSYIEQYHYLGYDRSIGENMKYTVYAQDGKPLACLAYGSAAWSCMPRDIVIGWNREQRASNLRYLTNNSRFLIFPWIRASCLASHILGRISRRISSDWFSKYGHPLYLLETYVECDRFTGTCYQAANWINVGFTTGKGRNCKTTKGELPVKDVYLYPLTSKFRKHLLS